jgi:hypothetical protein
MRRNSASVHRMRLEEAFSIKKTEILYFLPFFSQHVKRMCLYILRYSDFAQNYDVCINPLRYWLLYFSKYLFCIFVSVLLR